MGARADCSTCEQRLDMANLAEHSSFRPELLLQPVLQVVARHSRTGHIFVQKGLKDKMSHNDERDHKGDDQLRLPGAVRLAIWITVVWLIILGSIVAASQPCPLEETAAAALRVPYLSCRPLNEIGDFLAGAFAPLAFLWLVVTVLVQAQELREQRKEVRLSRKEFELNRQVAEETRKEIAAQAEAARNAATYLGAQTELFKLEGDRRGREEADALFYTSLRTTIRDAAGLTQPIMLTSDFGETRFGAIGANLPEEPEAAFGTLCARIRDLDNTLGLLASASSVRAQGVDEIRLSMIGTSIASLVSSSYDCSPAVRNLVAAADARGMAGTVQKILKAVAR